MAAGPVARAAIDTGKPKSPATHAAEIPHFLHGERRAGTSGRSGQVWNPSTGALTGEVPFATRSQPRNEMSVGFRLLWIFLIATGAAFSAGMFLAGLESLARLLQG